MSDSAIAELLAAIPESVRWESGTALYTGLASWTQPNPLYVMGINPGGRPGGDTVYGNAEAMLRDPRKTVFSDWVNGRWAAPSGRLYEAGQHPLQRRFLHLFDVLGVDPRYVPTSNMIYVRSRQANHIAANRMNALAEECWPFHARMIERLRARVVLCMGRQVAWFVRSKVGAHTEVDRFRETYDKRSSMSVTYTGPGVTVVQVTHPRYANWVDPRADVSPLVARALAGVNEWKHEAAD